MPKGSGAGDSTELSPHTGPDKNATTRNWAPQPSDELMGCPKGHLLHIEIAEKGERGDDCVLTSPLPRLCIMRLRLNFGFPFWSRELVFPALF